MIFIYVFAYNLVDLSIGYSKDISKNTTIGARFIHTKEAGHVKSAQDKIVFLQILSTKI